ncbi:S8 family serine peptidase [Cellulomonas fimi]|uniref:S8 family serine peptidase n=1 Tax=Cellulomonas fimi TaxID=1708 RepID=A0A7Y0LWF5_CELFI|nr:S8 family serine peptidase [Cellulomonas fimi]NMR19467.1 S8 family serine peptidase [Cellulomonas fimi]
MRRRTSPRALTTAACALLLAAGLVTAPAQAAPQPDDVAAAADRFTAQGLTPESRETGVKSPSARLAQTDPELLARTDSEPVAVVLKLDADATAVYAGGVADLAPTSPAVTGEELTGDSPAEQAYTEFLVEQEEAVIADLQDAVPTAEVGTRLRTVYGGIAATIPANAVESVLAIDGVAAVQEDSLRQPLTDASPEFLNTSPVYAALGGAADAGEGVLYGNLDSGVWPEHPSLADLGNLKPPPGPARACDYGDNPLTPADDPFVCNNKLVGGQAFLTTYLSNPDRAAAEPFRTARDSNGHGTHTATTSAGNVVDDVSVLGAALPPIQGIAPGAWVMEYKVCGIDGCFSSDSAAAVAQAIEDGVDVINFSISGGEDPFTDPVELAFLDAYAAGVVVAASAGNDGPSASTANHLSPWVITVAASTQTREFGTTLTLESSDGATATFDGASITPGIGELPVVLASAPPYSDALCQAPAPAGLFDGKIVACQRGVNARVDKGFNVLQGGAEAMVLYNPALQDVETDTHWLPSVHLADGTDFLAFMAAHADVTGSFPDAQVREGQGDVMAAFSSRGPAGLFLKPDVTAPGVQVLAGDTPISEGSASGPAGEYFQAIAGTSMSSPQVAGAAVLVRALHPDWTPGQIKSALMTRSVEDVLKEDLVTPADPFDMGAGRIDVGQAASATLTFDETAARFQELGADPVNAVDLNLASINAPVMPGELTTTRTFTNTGDRRVIVNASTEAPAGSTITVSPRRMVVGAGESATFTVTITSDAAIGEQQFGSIELSANRGAGTYRLPVAFIHTQGEVTLTQTCTPDEVVIRGDATATCTVQATNGSADEQVVNLTSTVDGSLRVVDATGATVVSNREVRRSAVTLEGAAPGVPSVDPGASPAGYLPLDAAPFSITPIAVGDEEVLNFNVPAFTYNGVSYSSLGVDSNGYLVAGGATAEDNNCCNLPTGPDDAPPNNVLAPFWTDLDGTGAEGILVGTLTDGVSSWIVVEFRLFVWGTTSERVSQVWIETGPEQGISFAYDPTNLPADPAGQAFLVGAENEIGQGDMESVLPTTDLVVTSSDPTPGDAATYTYTVRGVRPGAGVATTEMVADGVPGTTVVTSEIAIRRR